MRAWIGVVALSLVCSAQGFAQGQPDAAAVCAVAEKHYAAIRAGDSNTILQQHMPDHTYFPGDGALLWAFLSIQQQRTEFQEMAQSFINKTYIRHCNAQVYGSTGIATYYLVGSVAVDGRTTTGTWRVTEVWVKQGTEWKEAHHHESPLVAGIAPSSKP